MRAPLPKPGSVRPFLLAVSAGLLLAGCEGDTARLVGDINAARAGCTQAGLKASSEECVQMMQRYAEMGTEAMKTYIGGVKALDQALDRMPPPNFDTAGLGHALGAAARDSIQRWRAPGGARAGGAGAGYADPRGGRWGEAGYADPRARGGAGYYEEWDDGYGEPYGSAYDPRYAPAPRAYDPRLDSRAGGPVYELPRGAGPRRGGERYDAPDTEAPARGELLPPGQRLSRPWLRDGRARYGRDERYAPYDGSRYEYPPRPRTDPYSYPPDPYGGRDFVPYRDHP